MDFRGYVSSLQSGQFADYQDEWITENLIHNRLNFNFYFGEHVTLNAEFRNRLIWGTTKQIYPNYTEIISGENGWVEMDHAWIDGTSVLLHSKVDRLAMEFNFGKFNLKVGRQRINWARTYVWNSNDIFNSYSFFDFDYIERPGSDAIRATYYIGMASQVETAIKLNAEGKITAAGYGLMNVKGYDVQFFGGIVDEREYVFGTGWAGNIWDLGFKGEATYLIPRDEYKNRYNEGIIVSTGLEYMFENQFMLRTEYLYNDAAPSISDLSQLLLAEQSLRNLSFSRNNVFVAMDYPVTPLFNVSLSGMWMAELKGFFAGPTLLYSLKDNLDASLVIQHFNMEPDGVTERVRYTQSFLKVMYSF